MATGFVAALTISWSSVPQARADDVSFVRSAKELGFPQASDNLISMGRSACYFLHRHRTRDEVAARIMRYASVDSDRAGRFLDLAIAEYCPP